MLELQKAGYINKAEGNKQKGYHYEVVNAEEYKQLRERINSSLDEILERIKKPTAKSQKLTSKESSDSPKEVQAPKRTTKKKENQAVKKEVQSVKENATEQKIK